MQNYTVLQLACEDGLPVFSPGQYFSVAAKKGGVHTPMRCFSAVSIPGSNTLELVFRRAGDSTQSIARLMPGTEVALLGPFGEFVLSDDTTPVVLISSGIGITPFLSMIRNEIARPSGRKMRLLASARRVADLPHVGSIKNSVANPQNLSVELYSGEVGQDTIHARIDEKVVSEVVSSQPISTNYYICGPDGFASEIEHALLKHGVAQSKILSESFAQAEHSHAGKSTIQTVVWSVLSASGILLLFFVITNALNTTSGTNTSTSDSSTSYSSENTDYYEDEEDSDDEASSSSSNSSSSSGGSQTYSQPSSSSYSQPVSTAS